MAPPCILNVGASFFPDHAPLPPGQASYRVPEYYWSADHLRLRHCLASAPGLRCEAMTVEQVGGRIAASCLPSRKDNVK
jgi:hypothetical protein